MMASKQKRDGAFDSAPSDQFKRFQIRWKEKLGNKDNPYMTRYVLLLFGYSIRLHIWNDSDDQRYPHDHAFDFITIVLKGGYLDRGFGEEYCGYVFDQLERFSVRYRQAEHRHIVKMNRGKTITLLFCGKMRRKWGFWVKGRKLRPLKYFSKLGHH